MKTPSKPSASARTTRSDDSLGALVAVVDVGDVVERVDVGDRVERDLGVGPGHRRAALELARFPGERVEDQDLHRALRSSARRVAVAPSSTPPSGDRTTPYTEAARARPRSGPRGRRARRGPAAARARRPSRRRPASRCAASRPAGGTSSPCSAGRSPRARRAGRSPATRCPRHRPLRRRRTRPTGATRWRSEETVRRV